jgi:transposase
LIQNLDVRFTRFNLYFQDESRFGLFTRNGRSLTASGVKPIVKFQQVFLSTYLYGAFSPITGDKFLLELPSCNGDNFQTYLDEFSIVDKREFKIIVLDNGAFHKAKKLKIPENIALIFLPAYSPELNPAEKIWAKYKRAFTNKFHKTLDQVSEFIKMETLNLTANQVKSICSYEYVFLNSNWTI